MFHFQVTWGNIFQLPEYLIIQEMKHIVLLGLYCVFHNRGRGEGFILGGKKKAPYSKSKRVSKGSVMWHFRAEQMHVKKSFQFWFPLTNGYCSNVPPAPHISICLPVAFLWRLHCQKQLGIVTALLSPALSPALSSVIMEEDTPSRPLPLSEEMTTMIIKAIS